MRQGWAHRAHPENKRHDLREVQRLAAQDLRQRHQRDLALLLAGVGEQVGLSALREQIAVDVHLTNLNVRAAECLQRTNRRKRGEPPAAEKAVGATAWERSPRREQMHGRATRNVLRSRLSPLRPRRERMRGRWSGGLSADGHGSARTTSAAQSCSSSLHQSDQQSQSRKCVIVYVSGLPAGLSWCTHTRSMPVRARARTRIPTHTLRLRAAGATDVHRTRRSPLRRPTCFRAEGPLRVLLERERPEALLLVQLHLSRVGCEAPASHTHTHTQTQGRGSHARAPLSEGEGATEQEV